MFCLNYFHVSMKNLERAASDRDMLVPARTGVVEARSRSMLEFIIEFTAAMDDKFRLEEREAIWRSSTITNAFDFSLLEGALLSGNDILL